MEEEERATSTFSEVDVLLLTSTMPSDRLQLYALAGSDTHDLASLDPHSLGGSPSFFSSSAHFRSSLFQSHSRGIVSTTLAARRMGSDRMQ